MKVPVIVKPLGDDEDEKKEDSIDVSVKYREFSSDDNYLLDADDLNPKTIISIEKIVRSSYEYNKYIGYLKNELDITSCKFVPEVDIKNIKGVSIEFHHFPFTLFDITEAITKKELESDETGEGISMFQVASKVMEEHFRNNIGLVPLTKTVHEMAHNDAIKIPVSYAYGNYEEFYINYKNYLSKEADHKWKTAKTFNNSIEAQAANNAKLKKRIIKFKNKSEDNDE